VSGDRLLCALELRAVTDSFGSKLDS